MGWRCRNASGAGGVAQRAQQVPDSSASLPAIFYTAAILGPAAGYLVGGALLNIYTEIGQR